MKTSSLLWKHFALTTLVAVVGFTSCATDSAQKMRTDKSTTVGIWGGAYRPNGKVGVVADVSGMVSRSSTDQHVSEKGEVETGKSKQSNLQEIKTVESHKFDVGLHLYPFAKSAFFYGLGFQRKTRETRFDGENVGSSLTTPSFSNVEMSDDITSVGPSVGWDWIWTNGITLLLDVGPRIEASKSRNVKTQDSSQIDTSRRDKMIKKIDNSRGFSLFEPRLILGYSF